MISSFSPAPGRKWPRGQRFRLTPTGLSAESAYRETIGTGRAAHGSDSLAGAQQEWATQHGIEAGDGLFITELAQGQSTLAEVTQRLEVCGTTARQVKAAIERLIEAGMVEAIPSTTPVATPGGSFVR